MSRVNEHDDADGSDVMYIKLISSDDHEFIVKREDALVSGTIRAMLTGPGSESPLGEIRFKEIPSHVLSCICKYLVFKKRYENSQDMPPEFVIDPKIALEVMLASSFFDC